MDVHQAREEQALAQIYRLGVGRAVERLAGAHGRDDAVVAHQYAAIEEGRGGDGEDPAGEIESGT
jgi:hypothetical protein